MTIVCAPAYLIFARVHSYVTLATGLLAHPNVRTDARMMRSS